MDIQLPPPDNEDDFESLVCELFNTECGATRYLLYGRRGQKQHGIDIISKLDNKAIQCKKKDILKRNDDELLRELKKDLKESLEQLKGLPSDMGKVKEFVLAHTWKSHTDLDGYAATFTNQKLLVYYMSWEKITEKMRLIPGFAARYYESTQATKLLTIIPGYSPSSLIGRKKELADIHQYLIEDRVPMALMNGIGGMGKTSIASAYVNAPEYTNAYRAIAWVSVGNDLPQSFFSAFGGLSGFYEYDPKITPDDNFHHLLKKLRDSAVGKLKPSLLVLDNINETAMLDKYDRTLKDLGWRCLITSRTNVESFQTIPVGALSYEDASELFRKYFRKPIEEQQLKELLNTIEYNTLLIDLLAKAGQADPRITSIANINAALAKADFNAPELQRLVDSDHPDSQPIEDGKERQRRIKIAAYLKEIFKFTDLNEDEKQYLRYFSLLPPGSESYDRLSDIFGITPDMKDSFIDVLNELVRKGWVQQEENSYQVHILVKRITFNVLGVDTKNCALFIERIASYINDMFKENITLAYSYIELGESILSNLLPSDMTFSQSDYCLAILLNNILAVNRALGYLKELKKRTLLYAEIINQSCSDATDIRAFCYSNVGTTLCVLGDYDLAISFLNESVSLWTTMGNGYDNLLASCYNSLGGSYKYLNKVIPAIQHYNLAFELWSKDMEHNRGHIGILFNNLSGLNYSIGNIDEALRLLLKAEEMFNKYPHTDLMSLLSLYTNLSSVYLSLNNSNDTLKYVSKIAAIVKSTEVLSEERRLEYQKYISKIYTTLNLPQP